jgi:predicted enzyme related to lactoylglutathione lyase
VLRSEDAPRSGARFGAVTTPTVVSFIAATYVRDIDRSRSFYEALGFSERFAGRNDLSAWSSLHHGRHSILLVTSTPAPEIPPLPLLFYFYVDDVGAAIRALQDRGAAVTHVGYPPHASGGEARTTDPDGNTVLLGQRDGVVAPEEPAEEDRAQRFSLLREAAALARQRAGVDTTCQVVDVRHGPCTRPAEVKLADSWGRTAWACLPHADEVLITAHGAFIASDDGDGLARYVTDRRATR